MPAPNALLLVQATQKTLGAGRFYSIFIVIPLDSIPMVADWTDLCGGGGVARAAQCRVEVSGVWDLAAALRLPRCRVARGMVD